MKTREKKDSDWKKQKRKELGGRRRVKKMAGR